jgi:predicted Zn-dependent protease
MFLAALLVTCACATNPATGQRQLSLMSEDEELRVGVQQDADVRREMGVYDDRALQQYVSDIGLRLASQSERPNLPWHFTIVDVPAVNAFALPGGYIYVTRGIMPFLADEAELACVLGHEIGHVTARHAAQQYSKSMSAGLGVLLGSIFVPEARPFGGLAQTGLGALILKYGRDDELQADELGVRYAARGGWDASAMSRMLTTLGRIDDESDNKGVPNWLSTHPSPENRIGHVEAAVEQAQSATRGIVNRDAYLSRVNGIVYGDNPDQGVVRGSAFLHPSLRFAIQFPRGWDVTNGQSQVVAKEPGVNAFMILQPVTRPVGRGIEDAAVQSMERGGFRALDGEETTINGLSAFVATYQGSVQELGRVRLRAAHIVYDRSVYLVAGLAPLTLYEPHEPAFTQAIDSFRPMTRGEAETVRPTRINLYTARAGDTWQSIAEHVSGGTIRAATLAIMNSHAIAEQPRPGERLKVVV